MKNFEYQLFGNKENLNHKNILGVFTTRSKTSYSKNFIDETINIFKKDIVIVFTYETYRSLGLDRAEFKKIIVFDEENCKNIPENIDQNSLFIKIENLPTEDLKLRYLLKDIFITDISRNILILEATNYSKNLEILATYCADKGINVFCLPGRINDFSSRGTNRMIFHGAIPLFSMDLLKI